MAILDNWWRIEYGEFAEALRSPSRGGASYMVPDILALAILRSGAPW